MSEQKLANLPSERLVLGGIYQHGIEAFVDVSQILVPESFTDPKNQNLYQIFRICMERGSSVDPHSIYSAACDIGLSKEMESKENVEYLNVIKTTKVNLDNVISHAKIVRRLQFGRELQDTIRESYKSTLNITGTETLSEIQSLAESPIQLLSLKYKKGDESRPELLGAGLEEYVQHLKDNPNTLKGISTGFGCYDRMIGGGLNRQCVDVFAARKKEGKSILADNMAYNICTKNIPTLMLDTEMKKEEHYDRLLAKLAQININDISQATFVNDDKKIIKVDEAVAKLNNLPYTYAKVAGKKFADILSLIRRWLLQDVGYDSSGRLNDCVVIYDYFKMNNTDDMNDLTEWQSLGFQMSALKDFTADYDFPVLTFVQSNRDGINTEDSSIVARSDAIMDTATSLTIYKTKTVEEIANDGGIRCGNKKFVPVMYRHGPGLDNDYVNVMFQGEYGNIYELGTRNNMISSGTFHTTIDEEENKFE